MWLAADSLRVTSWRTGRLRGVLLVAALWSWTEDRGPALNAEMMRDVADGVRCIFRDAPAGCGTMLVGRLDIKSECELSAPSGCMRRDSPARRVRRLYHHQRPPRKRPRRMRATMRRTAASAPCDMCDPDWGVPIPEVSLASALSEALACTGVGAVSGAAGSRTIMLGGKLE